MLFKSKMQPGLITFLTSLFYRLFFMPRVYDFETRNSIFEGIMEALADDDNFSMIGLYGIAGV